MGYSDLLIMTDRRLDRRKVLAGTGSLIVAGLAGCSGDGGGGNGNGDDNGDEAEPTPTPTQDAEVVNVFATEFQPSIVQIEAGSTVSWRHRGGSHTILFYHPDNDRQRRVPEGVEAISGAVNPSDAFFEYTFETPGVYDYYSQDKEESDQMIGSVIVGEPTDPEQPGLSEPSEEFGPFASQQVEQLNTEVKNMLGI